MKCCACQTELPNEAKFCNVCGEKLEIDCPECNRPNPPDSKFCLACGQRLATEPPTVKSETIADAERKQVTALFSDLSGYTPMTERLDPEEVKEITGQFVDGVRAIVGKYDGFIEKFAGDGVLAMFGVPKAHEDDAVRAIRAAREIHELVEGMNPKYEARIGAHLSMHSGIHTGLAVTAEVDPEKGIHGMTGATISIAARLSGIAKAGEILMGPVTQQQVEAQFVSAALGPVSLKGKSEPIPIYKVLSLKEQPISVHRQSGMRADLIGRNAELIQLQEAVERLMMGKGSVISVYGGPGTGKSRLVEEFKASLDLDKIRWREGHAYPYAQNISYFPLIDLMNRAWQIEEGDPPATVREKVESGIERLLGKEQQVTPYVGSLYALSYPEIEDVSPEFWQSRLFEGIQTIVAALTQYGPTVFCFEDIHWADSSMMDLLRYIISELRNPALFLCLYRPPFNLFTSHQLKGLGKRYEEIQLLDLSPSDTQEMLKSLLKTQSIPAELRKFASDKIEGNPFYLEETINSLVESGILARENGTWRLTGRLDESAAPATVQGVIAARLDRLDRQMKRVLQEASVIGRAFLFEILKKITEIKEPIDSFLNGLERLDLIRARSLQPELEYIFKHALTQEVVYNGLLKKERQEIHERTGLVMEHLFRDRLAEFYETLAFHFKQGLSLTKAVNYLMKAGAKSLNRFALDEAYQYYKEGYEILEGKAEKTQADRKLLIDLLIELGPVIYFRGGSNEYIDLLAAHEGTAVAIGDDTRLGMFYAWSGWSRCWRAKLNEAVPILEKSLKIGREIQSHQIIGYASCWLAWACGELGRLDDALAYAEKALEMHRLLPSDQYLYTKPLGGIGHACWFKGEWKRALDVGKQIVDFSLRHSNIRGLVMGYMVSALAYITKGDFDQALENCQKALGLNTDPFYTQYIHVGQSFAYLGAERLDEAKQAARLAVEWGREFGWEWPGSHCEPVLGVVSILQGDMAGGMSQLEGLARRFRQDDREVLYAFTEHLIGSVYLQMALGEGKPSLSTIIRNIGFIGRNFFVAASKAADHLNKAIEVAQEIGAKGTLGEAYLGLGRLHIAKRKKDEARECISKAIDLFEQCEIETRLKEAREVLDSLG